MAVSRQFGGFRRYTVRVQAHNKGEVLKTETYSVFTNRSFEDVTTEVQKALEAAFGVNQDETEEVEEEAPVAPVRTIRRKRV